MGGGGARDKPYWLCAEVVCGTKGSAQLQLFVTLQAVQRDRVQHCMHCRLCTRIVCGRVGAQLVEERVCGTAGCAQRYYVAPRRLPTCMRQ
jgi:hypothetical protein